MKNQKSNPTSNQTAPLGTSDPSASPSSSEKIPSSPTDSTTKLDQSNYDASGLREIGGQKGPEPTRYGDWEKNGRCTDF